MAPEPTDPSPSTPFIPGFATALGEAAAHLNERLLDTRIVVVGGEINDASANTVCSQLLVLDAASPGDTPGPPGDRRKDISLYINSPGGSVDAGFAIYDTMQSLDCDVVTVAMGLAASMGHLLLVGGTPGKRFALRHSQILMHQPHGQMSGVASDILVHADHIGALRRLMAERIAFHTGQPVDRVVADFDRDRWFSAEEALEYGMIDAVLDHRSQLRSLPYGTKSSRRTPPNPPAQARLS